MLNADLLANLDQLVVLNLESVDARGVSLKSLPEKELWPETEMNLIQATVSPEKLEAFRRKNPENRIWTQYNEPLEYILSQATSVRIYGYKNGCGIDTTIIQVRDEVLCNLSLHHMESLRWTHGPWYGNARLKKESRADLISWLDDHGVRW